MPSKKTRRKRKRKHGTNYSHRWIECSSLPPRKSLSSKRFSTKKLNSTDYSKSLLITLSFDFFRRSKISVHDYDPLKIIGRGAFGEVRVCRHKKTDEIVAIKKMKKNEMIIKNQEKHIKAERDILAIAQNNPWIVELKCSFQDEKFLYLVMEFLQGGDLMTLLIEKDILTEEESRFYIAETILAVKSVHDMNYIHRDLKPDNLLIGSDGHVKLSDFGLCKHVEIKSLPKELQEKMKNE